MSDDGALLRDREDARRELARITAERDSAREQRDAAIDREAKALLQADYFSAELAACQRRADDLTARLGTALYRVARAQCRINQLMDAAGTAGKAVR